MPIAHPLVTTLKSLHGNARGAVLTEPLWGIPYNLYAPYVSIYMLALGLTDAQIGLLASISLALQIFWTLLSGALTDKLGRKRTTLIFDLLSWSVPCLIWAVAQDFTYFLVAAIFNSIWRVTHNSWQCLLVEDTDPRLLVDIYSWIYIAGLVAAFFSPLTGLLIARLSLVPTLRGLYLLSFVLMTAKFLIMNEMVTETRQGLVRMHETQGQSLWAIVGESWQVLQEVARTPATLFTGALLLIVSISSMISSTFWSILVTEKLEVPAQYLAIYPFARSMTMLVFFFTVMPRLRHVDVRRPMVFGFAGLVIVQAILITAPARSYLLLLVATILEGCSIPASTTLLDKLIAISVDPRERARIIAILYVAVIALTAPFGWIAGQLSEINRSLPFVLTFILYGSGGALTYWATRLARVRIAASDAADD